MLDPLPGAMPAAVAGRFLENTLLQKPFPRSNNHVLSDASTVLRRAQPVSYTHLTLPTNREV